MTHRGVINLIGGYIKAYIDDYKENPEELKRLLKRDKIVTLAVDEDYIDYIVRESQRVRTGNRRCMA